MVMSLDDINRELESAQARLDRVIEAVIDDLTYGTDVKANMAKLKIAMDGVSKNLLESGNFRETLKNASNEDRSKYLEMAKKAADEAKRKIDMRLRSRDDAKSYVADIDNMRDNSNQKVYNTQSSFEDVKAEEFDLEDRKKQIKAKQDKVTATLAYRKHMEELEGPMASRLTGGKTIEDVVIEDIENVKNKSKEHKDMKETIDRISNIDFKATVQKLEKLINAPGTDKNSQEIKNAISDLQKQCADFDKVILLMAGPGTAKLIDELNPTPKNIAEWKKTIGRLNGHISANPNILNRDEKEEDFKDFIDDAKIKEDFEYDKAISSPMQTVKRIIGENGEKLVREGKFDVLDRAKKNIEGMKDVSKYSDADLQALKDALDKKMKDYETHISPRSQISIGGETMDFGEGEDMTNPNVSDKKFDEYLKKINEMPEDDAGRKKFDDEVKNAIGRPMPEYGRFMGFLYGLRKAVTLGFWKTPKDVWKQDYYDHSVDVLENAINKNKEAHEQADITVTGEEEKYKNKLYNKMWENAQKITRKDKKKAKDELDPLGR